MIMFFIFNRFINLQLYCNVRVQIEEITVPVITLSTRVGQFFMIDLPGNLLEN